MRLVILERPMAKKICSEAVVVLLDNLRINFGEPGFLTFSQASLARRLEAARGELEYGRAEGNFDLRLVNDQVGVFTVRSSSHVLTSSCRWRRPTPS